MRARVIATLSISVRLGSTLQQQSAADDRQHHRNGVAHVTLIDAQGQSRTDDDARDRPDEEGAQQAKIDVAEAHMTQARNQREWDGVRDVGTNELARSQSERIQVYEHDHAKRTGTDGSEGHQKA